MLLRPLFFRIGRDGGLELPLHGLDRRVGRGTSFLGIVDVGRAGGLVDLMILPFPGEPVEAGVGLRLRVKALGLKMIELFLDRFVLFLLRLSHPLFRLVPGGLGGDDEPALLDTVMAQIDTLVPIGFVQLLPLIPGPGLLDELLDDLNAFRDPRQERRILLGVMLSATIKVGVGAALNSAIKAFARS